MPESLTEKNLACRNYFINIFGGSKGFLNEVLATLLDKTGRKI